MKPAAPKSNMKESPSDVLLRSNGCADPPSEINNKEKLWNAPENECSMIVDEFTNANKSEPGDSVTRITVPTELFEKEPDIYTDKNVTDCELPELIVCYKDNMYHDIKDICIDEGVPSESSILTDSVEDYHKGLIASLPSIGNKHCDITNEGVDTEFLTEDGLNSSGKHCDKDATNESGTNKKVDIDSFIPDGLKSSSEDDSDREASDECGLDELKSSSESGSDHELANGDVPVDPVQTRDKICESTKNIMVDSSREEFVSNSGLSVEEIDTQTSLQSLLNQDGRDDLGQQSGQISSSEVEAISEDPAEVSTAEKPNKSCIAEDLHYDSRVESGTITFNFESSKLASGTKDEGAECLDSRALKSENVPIREHGFSGDLSVATQVQHDGESSFTMAGPTSGVITYSEPIAFSGSLSLRSDSSTTSTRSFAFPVLSTEWNSSPVRMAKADRRHIRKHRGWRMGLLCCRF